MYTYDATHSMTQGYGYGLATFIKLKSGSRDAFVEAMEKVAGAACLSPGCIDYVVSGLRDDPESVFVIEFWRSDEDQRGALQSPAIMELIDYCNPLIDHFDQKPLVPLA